jgi:NAD(P)H dehydrogenase (quinone)
LRKRGRREEPLLEWKWVFIAFLASGGMLEAGGDEARELVLVVYDSRSGNTEALARAVGEGAETVEGTEVLVKRTGDVRDEDILRCSGMILGSPVHWGSLSPEAKAFVERVGGVLSEAKELGPRSTPRLRAAGAFATGGAVSSGKELARLAMLTAFLNLRFVVVGGEERDGFGTLGAQATTGEADPGLSESELDEARRFGARVASVTLALVR